MSADDPAQPGTRPARPCPICGKPASAPWRPFCSKRCSDIDLGRWLGEAYRIPAEEVDTNDTTAEEESDKGRDD